MLILGDESLANLEKNMGRDEHHILIECCACLIRDHYFVESS